MWKLSFGFECALDVSCNKLLLAKGASTVITFFSFEGELSLVGEDCEIALEDKEQHVGEYGAS